MGGEVRGKNVQAWVELSVQGHGWVTVPTSVFTPDRSKQPDPNQRQNNDQESIRNVPPPNPVPPREALADDLGEIVRVLDGGGVVGERLEDRAQVAQHDIGAQIGRAHV